MLKNKSIKLKINDNVKVMAGKDKGREGKIEKIFPKKNTVLVTGVNMYKKHVKGSQGIKAGIYDIPRAMNISKVSIICPNCKKIAKIGITKEKNETMRICKKCKGKIDKIK